MNKIINDPTFFIFSKYLRASLDIVNPDTLGGRAVLQTIKTSFDIKSLFKDSNPASIQIASSVFKGILGLAHPETLEGKIIVKSIESTVDIGTIIGSFQASLVGPSGVVFAAILLAYDIGKFIAANNPDDGIGLVSILCEPTGNPNYCLGSHEQESQFNGIDDDSNGDYLVRYNVQVAEPEILGQKYFCCAKDTSIFSSKYSVDTVGTHGPVEIKWESSDKGVIFSNPQVIQLL